MAIQSSYHTVSEQIINYNNNVVNLLSDLNALVTSTDPSVTITISKPDGTTGTFTLPSFGFLKSEIDRLNNNLNSIYNIDSSGAVIQPSTSNIFQKVVLVNLNKEPNDVGQLPLLSSFTSKNNLFFDNLVNPEMFISINLSGQIDNNVREALVRKYIIEFETDSSGNYTALGQSAINSFNSLWRNQSNIIITEFANWYQTTPGIANPAFPNFDERVYSLDPNQLQYNGLFTVIQVVTDILNKKLWYEVNTLQYVNTQTNQIKQLAVGDQLLVNTQNSTTVYQIIEISTTTANPQLRFQRIEGNQPIPVGVGTLKFYSPIVYTSIVEVPIGYNERSVIFVKPLNTENFLLSKNWSPGTGFWTNDLRLSSSDANNGLSMQQFYVSNVTDYGEVIRDLVAKKIPNTLGTIPPPPVLNAANFQVLQVNTHLTNTPDSATLKQKNNQQKSIQSLITQLNNAIQDKNKQIKTTRFTSDAAKKQAQNDLNNLQAQKTAQSQMLTSVTNDILNMSQSPVTTVQPEYSVQGFWTIPSPVVTTGTNPQQIVQFNIQYKRLAKGSATEPPVNTIPVTDSSSQKVTTGAISNWVTITTPALQRNFNPSTGTYTWVQPNISDADTPNINQLNIPIQSGETIVFRIQSISEVGWPDSPLLSAWSETISIDFPDSLNNSTNQNSTIINDANKQDIQSTIQSNLSAQGLDTLLSGITTVNNNTYIASSDQILSGFKDSNSVATDLFTYLQSLEARVAALEAAIQKSTGQLQVIVFRNSDQFVVKNGSELSFTVECEDYLDNYTANGVPTGRVYANNIYVIKDFLVKFSNASTTSPLGLLSSRTYNSTTNADVYNSSAPQVFWVDSQNELIVSNVTGKTNTQLDNQFIWMVNYDNINQTSVTKLSDNIGNAFVSNNSNSVTNVLSSSEFNLGYSEATILSFVGNNNSLLDASKWIDTNISVSSTTKLLTTIHPQDPGSAGDLTDLVETNSAKNHELSGGSSNDINIPINIYFKLNALDSTQAGLNYQYVNFNSVTQTVRHVKKIKFFLEDDADNRPFVFDIKFTINRNKVVVNKNFTNTSIKISS